MGNSSTAGILLIRNPFNFFLIITAIEIIFSPFWQFSYIFFFAAENTDAEIEAASQSDGSCDLFLSSIPTSGDTLQSRELLSKEQQEGKAQEKSSLDKVLEEMLDSDEGDKTFRETSAENKA